MKGLDSILRPLFPGLYAAQIAEEKRAAEKLVADAEALKQARSKPWPEIKGVTYQIVKGDDLKPGDHIIDRGSRFLIVDCGQGVGAGTDDYGQYVWVKGLYKKSDKPVDFWVFQGSPIVKVIQS